MASLGTGISFEEEPIQPEEPDQTITRPSPDLIATLMFPLAPHAELGINFEILKRAVNGTAERFNEDEFPVGPPIYADQLTKYPP
jgi:hypothetical protein